MDSTLKLLQRPFGIIKPSKCRYHPSRLPTATARMRKVQKSSKQYTVSSIHE
jgi:hypothetical protein